MNGNGFEFGKVRGESGVARLSGFESGEGGGVFDLAKAKVKFDRAAKALVI
jgi:hypothetical protein